MLSQMHHTLAYSAAELAGKSLSCIHKLSHSQPRQGKYILGSAAALEGHPCLEGADAVFQCNTRR